MQYAYTFNINFMHCPHAVESWSDILPSIKEKNGTGRKSNVVSSMDLDHISDDKFIDALDRAADRCKDYWTGCQGYLESYKDVHPAIVCSENNNVEVYVRGE